MAEPDRRIKRFERLIFVIFVITLPLIVLANQVKGTPESIALVLLASLGICLLLSGFAMVLRCRTYAEYLLRNYFLANPKFYEDFLGNPYSTKGFHVACSIGTGSFFAFFGLALLMFILN